MSDKMTRTSRVDFFFFGDGGVGSPDNTCNNLCQGRLCADDYGENVRSELNEEVTLQTVSDFDLTVLFPRPCEIG